MNFIKNTMFKKSDKAAVQKEVVLHGGVLAVWGSPSSGKSIVATKIAKHLADKGKNVVLLLCDMTAPMLPCICPPSDLESNHSLGSVLAAPHVSETLVKYHIITHKKMNHLTILGMQKGENEYSYTPYTETQARELIAVLRKIAPFVIIDCGSHIASDVLSTISLLESDAVLRLASCDLKSISYFSGQNTTLKGTGFDFEKQYKCASNVKPQQSVEHMGGALGSLSFIILHSEELEQQYLDGNLLLDLTLKDSREFKREIEKIVKEVFS